MPQLVLPSFRHPQLLQQALSHRSYTNENPGHGDNNERLEFLGDAILNFLSGAYLFHRYPTKPEGELTPLRAALVDEAQLARFAIALNLGQHIRVGRGAELQGARHNPNLLSSAFEAVIGAYFLDSGADMHTVQQYVEPFFATVIDELATTAPMTNYKSRLQEWVQKAFGENPVYAIVAESGPDHAKTFQVEVRVHGRAYGHGTGHRKQDAEKAAARDALQRLHLLPKATQP
mgnify:FL=1